MPDPPGYPVGMRAPPAPGPASHPSPQPAPAGSPDPAASTTVAAEPLLPAVLALVREGGTAGQIAARFRKETEDTSIPRIRAMLHDLAHLGLVRATSADGRRRRYVVTSLGEQALRVSLAGPSDAVARLEDLERLRTDLFATIAHDLRTPLTAVRTCAGLLLDAGAEAAPEQRRQLVESIVRNADRMQRLVEDVLDLSRFRAGRVQLQLRRFDARIIARDLAASIAPLAAQRRQHLAVDLPEMVPWVYADHRRIEQAVLNLLSNAQKFSPEGATMGLSVRAMGSEVQWRVSDHGPGIAPEDQARLFERFFVGASAEAAVGGTGLGLPTALAIAQAHGGRIDVDSALGQGSRFTLAVPAAGPPGADEP